MTKILPKSEKIRQFIINHVGNNKNNIGKLTSDHFAITRQAVNKHLKRLLSEGTLVESGNTRNKVYILASLIEWQQTYQINKQLAEDVIWRNDIQSVLGNMSDNVLDIWHYGFTEMFNNAIDHSGGTEILIENKKNRCHHRNVDTR